MKKELAAASLILAIAAAAQGAPLATGFYVSAAPAVSGKASPSPQPKAINQANVTVKITKILAVPYGTPNWYQSWAQAYADDATGHMSTNPIASPTGYTAIGTNAIGWQNLGWSTSVSWNGTNNPAPPFDAEEGGPVVVLVVDVQTVDGSDGVSLADIQFTSLSSDGNLLGGTTNLTGLSYTSIATCTKASGTVLTSGDGSIKGAHLRFLEQPPLFHDDLATIQTWVDEHSPYSDQFSFVVLGSGTSAFYTKVSTAGTPVPAYSLMGKASGSGQMGLTILGGLPDTQYLVEGSSNLSLSWRPLGTMNGDDTFTNLMAQPEYYFRAISQ